MSTSHLMASVVMASFLSGLGTITAALPADAAEPDTKALIETRFGTMEVTFYPDKAPKTVNSLIFLACKGYFDGVTFHRVLDEFMAQGGDPTGTGTGGPGYQFEYEPNDLTFDKAGVVAMGNRGAGTPTNGSQFFITFGPTPELAGSYTIFGQVIQGMDVVNGLTRRDPQQNPSFQGDAMETITISEQ